MCLKTASSVILAIVPKTVGESRWPPRGCRYRHNAFANIDEAIVLGEKVLLLSEPPGKIVREFKIDLPRPRDKMTKEFTDLFIQVHRLLSGQLE